MKIVVDSSILIDYLRGGRKWEEFVVNLEEETELILPTIVIFELFSGESTKNPQRKQDMLDYIGKFQKIDLSEDIARRAGELFRDIKIKMQVPDYLIAASALEINAEVLTLNTKHFQQIPNLKIYQY